MPPPSAQPSAVPPSQLSPKRRSTARKSVSQSPPISPQMAGDDISPAVWEVLMRPV
ncbi:MAG TPA: hypothetical protein V6D29_06220 [Leptolyngbyaceae cyanobacterium]